MVMVVVGLQWGDEGKGKVVDLLSEGVDVVVRYQGGSNAGHTVVVGERKFVFHQLPSAALYPKDIVISGGVVLDLEGLFDEISELGSDLKASVHLDYRAHLIMPYHKLLDRLEEEKKGRLKIGTTQKGIGPAYVDKVARIGIRVSDLMDKDNFASKLSAVLDMKNAILSQVYKVKPFSFDEIYLKYLSYRDRISDIVDDATYLLLDAYNSGKEILFEGAQGALLDMSMGTYPYVTSSHPVVGGVGVETGFPVNLIDKRIGVFKAYTTRVGEGPFPTEVDGNTGEFMRERGGEFGATTGRPRRCGWLDIPALKYAIMINGVNELVVTKLDVLSGLSEIKVCVGYRVGGKVSDRFSTESAFLREVVPEYAVLPGWSEDISRVRDFSRLPDAAKRYLEFLEDRLGVRISMVGVGPEREGILKL